MYKATKESATATNGPEKRKDDDDDDDGIVGWAMSDDGIEIGQAGKAGKAIRMELRGIKMTESIRSSRRFTRDG